MGSDVARAPREQSSLGRGRAAYRFEKKFAKASGLASQIPFKSALTTEFAKFLVAMRLGVTPVPIPNTMVKTQAADGTALVTVWESRWLPNLK